MPLHAKSPQHKISPWFQARWVTAYDRYLLGGQSEVSEAEVLNLADQVTN